MLHMPELNWWTFTIIRALSRVLATVWLESYNIANDSDDVIEFQTDFFITGFKIISTGILKTLSLTRDQINQTKSKLFHF